MHLSCAPAGSARLARQLPSRVRGLIPRAARSPWRASGGDRGRRAREPVSRVDNGGGHAETRAATVLRADRRRATCATFSPLPPPFTLPLEEEFWGLQVPLFRLCAMRSFCSRFAVTCRACRLSLRIVKNRDATVLISR